MQGVPDSVTTNPADVSRSRIHSPQSVNTSVFANATVMACGFRPAVLPTPSMVSKYQQRGMNTGGTGEGTDARDRAVAAGNEVRRCALESLQSALTGRPHPTGRILRDRDPRGARLHHGGQRTALHIEATRPAGSRGPHAHADDPTVLSRRRCRARRGQPLRARRLASSGRDPARVRVARSRRCAAPVRTDMHDLTVARDEHATEPVAFDRVERTGVSWQEPHFRPRGIRRALPEGRALSAGVVTCDPDRALDGLERRPAREAPATWRVTGGDGTTIHDSSVASWRTRTIVLPSRNNTNRHSRWRATSMATARRDPPSAIRCPSIPTRRAATGSQNRAIRSPRRCRRRRATTRSDALQQTPRMLSSTTCPVVGAPTRASSRQRP